MIRSNFEVGSLMFDSSRLYVPISLGKILNGRIFLNASIKV